jgi:hypothetical protein
MKQANRLAFYVFIFDTHSAESDAHTLQHFGFGKRFNFTTKRSVRNSKPKCYTVMIGKQFQPVMAEAALVLAPLDVLESEVKEALDICGGDPMKALRMTLIANAFLEAQIDHLSAQISPGYTRRKRGNKT